MTQVSTLASQLRPYWLADTDSAIRAGDTITCDNGAPPPAPLPPPDDVPPPPDGGGLPPVPPGKGNLLYVCATNVGGNVGGIIRCVGAYDSTPVWDSINGSLNTAAKKNISGINFDPYSHNGNYYTKMWANTEDGLYLGTGVGPSGTPTWTKKLDNTSASTLTGKTVVLGKSFTPSVRLANWIGIVALETVGSDAVVSGTHKHIYILWSTNNGDTWNTNTSYWLEFTNVNGNGIYLYASYHNDGTYYVTGDVNSEIQGNQAGAFGNYYPPSGYGQVLAVKTTTLPQFSPHYPVQIQNATGAALLTFPYINQGGTSVLTNDDIVFSRGIGGVGSSGTNTIRRYTSFNTSDDGQPALFSYIGAAGMTGADQTQWFFFPHTFDENYIMGAYKGGAANLWVTSNGGTTWSSIAISFSGRSSIAGPVNLNFSQADNKIVYFLGADGSGNGYVGKTTNFGATMSDVSRYNIAGEYMGRAFGGSSDTIFPACTSQIILLDYYRV